MKIAVTSASGQLGSSIAKRLIAEIGRDNVIGLARTPKKAQHLGIEIRKGDYNDRDELDAALKDIDAVLLVSGMDEPNKRIEQHRNVINAAKINGVKKIVYTSIIGDEEETAFSPVVKSNRHTETDIKNSGLEWVIGRNGLYIEPDLEYLDNYVEDGEITNCAGAGKCSYTSREELGYAYTKMLTAAKHNSQIYNLAGEPISQKKLAGLINQVFKTELVYRPVTVQVYASERKEELGEFMGTIIAGIYEGISQGAFNVRTDFEKAAGRTHKPAIDMIRKWKKEHCKDL
ncbi:MAG: SDR family oxidoreductase [Pyrinomonadaceae bacterium]|nr:SDR family oxidoreductase [Pyrinomonadaceae bacterium]